MAAVLQVAKQTAADHVEHVAAIHALEDKVAQVESAQRPQLAADLYLELGLFVAENFEHMAVEETRNHAILVSRHSDQELLELEHRIVASMTPEQSMAGLRWMQPHINADERLHARWPLHRRARRETPC